MKNTIMSFITFFIVLGFVVIYNNKLVKVCDDTLFVSNQLEELIHEEKWSECYNKALELKKIMSDNFNSISIYTNHQDIDILNTEILKLTQFMREKDSCEGLASLHAIKSYAEYIKELQEVNIINIF